MATDHAPESVQAQLREIERGEHASWFVYPPTPAWWPVLFGAWSAALALVIGLMDGLPQALAQVGLVAVMGGLIGWDRRRRGTYPSGRPPRELHRPMLGLVVGAVVVGGLAWLVGELVSVWPAAAVAGLGAAVVVVWYERAYAAVAARALAADSRP